MNFQALVLILGSLLSLQCFASQAQFVDQPRKCSQAFSKNSMCALYFTSDGLLNMGGHRLFVKSKTSLSIHFGKTIELLAGEVFARTDAGQILEVKILRDGLQVQGDVLIRRESQDAPLEVVNLDAQINFQGAFLLGQVLPQGYQNWFSPGRTQPGFGVPRIFETEEVFRKLASFSQGPTKEIVELLKNYGELRKSAKVASAESYQGLVRRHYASVEEDKRQEKLRLQSLQREKDNLRRLYRARVLDGEYTQPFD